MAKKHLGQNFLVDTNVVKKIGALIVLKNHNIEIGAGTGILTREVLCNNPNKDLCIIEKDVNLAKILRKTHVNIICEDCLKCDLNCDVLFSSLPYNISSKFILKLCSNTSYDKCYLILQKEFIERLISMPGKNYGALSVLAQLHSDLKFHFDISNQCFSPVPKVISGFLELKFKKSLDKDFIDFIFKCFANRRKKLSNALNIKDTYLIYEAKELLNCRADQLTPQSYVKLYNQIKGINE